MCSAMHLDALFVLQTRVLRLIKLRSLLNLPCSTICPYLHLPRSSFGIMIANSLLFIISATALSHAVALVPPASALFPPWVYGNHTACSACSHFVPIDVESANAQAYARALQCNPSQIVVIVPGDTPIHTKQPLQLVRRPSPKPAHYPMLFSPAPPVSSAVPRSRKRSCACAPVCARAVSTTAAS